MTASEARNVHARARVGVWVCLGMWVCLGVRLVLPDARKLTIVYYWMGLGACPDEFGNAPPGAIQAFHDEF